MSFVFFYRNRRLHPLSFSHLRLRDHLILEKHRLLGNIQLTTSVLRFLVTMRWSFSTWSHVAVIIVFIIYFRMVWMWLQGQSLSLKASSPLGNDKTGPPWQLIDLGLGFLITTAFAGRRHDDQRDDDVWWALADVGVDLRIDDFVSVQELIHQLVFVPLLLNLLIHVVLQKLFAA